MSAKIASQLTDKLSNQLRIMAVDCCKHVIAALNAVPSAQLLPIAPKEATDLGPHAEVDLIVIGIARYPVRRLFISQLRRVFPNVPILLLRREQIVQGKPEEWVRGEFVLSDQSNSQRDCEIVNSLRTVMPFQSCSHLQKDQSYETVQRLIGILTESYSDPGLDLPQVARKIAISPKRLSVILNQQMGVSFRKLLRQVRLEEAKRMLRSRQYSVKEVAARTGFTDSHYFSRNFKEFTGQNAGEYQEKSVAV